MRALLLTPFLAAACTGGMQDPSTVEQQEGACIALEGLRFESVDDLECGLTPDGVARCKWALTFGTRDDASSTFQWSYSDVGEAGQVECDGEAITTSPRAVDVAFDTLTQKLVWDGQTYVPAN